MRLNNEHIRERNNRPNSMNNESMRANYRPMRGFCEHMRKIISEFLTNWHSIP